MLTFLAGLGLGLSLYHRHRCAERRTFCARASDESTFCSSSPSAAASNAVWIAAGVAGLGLLIEQIPWLLVIARWVGAAFLLMYGLLAARRALSRTGETLTADAPTDSRPTGRTIAVVLTTLALTWLNPHVYLDTVLMLGSIAATHGDNRWMFAAGAIAASILWFAALGYGARRLSKRLSTPRSWRTLDAMIALIMIGIAVSLVVQAIWS